MDARTVAATIVGNVVWFVATLFFGLAAIAVGWIPPRGRATSLIARWWSRTILAGSGVRLEARLARPLPPDEPRVYMANHQSMYDIPALLAALPGPTQFLAKRGLFRIPVFGWAIAVAGFVPVDRGDRSRAGETFAAAVERLKAGNSVLLFPEETRSDGDRLLPFRRGGFLLAAKSGLPIVPVGIRGTRSVRPRGSLRIRPGRVVVSFGEPVEVSGYGALKRGELIGEVRSRIAELAGMEEDGPGDPDPNPNRNRNRPEDR